MRVCACGCGTRLDGMHGNARYASNAHKSKAYRARTGYTLQAQRNACQTRKSSRSGMQVSYRKAVNVLADQLRAVAREPDVAAMFTDPRKAQLLAELALRQALPARQRAQLEQP